MASSDIGHNVETDHEYDGIREFDNPLPRWWLLTLYGAIIFAFSYWFYYHTLDAGGMSPMAVYEEEMAEAEAIAAAEAAKVDPEALLALSKDSAAIAAGKVAFDTNCVACHLAQGQGQIGPNLTDPYWIHGSGAKNIYDVVYSGSLAKGMPAWGQVLGPTSTQQVVAYVLTLKGTNVAGKAPEGKDDSGKPAP